MDFQLLWHVVFYTIIADFWAWMPLNMIIIFLFKIIKTFNFGRLRFEIYISKNMLLKFIKICHLQATYI